MTLLFGHRPFDFSDLFQMIMKGEIDFSNLNYIDPMMKSIDAGFTHIEITGDLPYALPMILTRDEINKIVELKKEKNLTFSVHLPLWAMEPAAFSHHIREGSIKSFVECIELTKPLDPICWVIHPTGTLTVEFMHMGLPEIAQGFLLQQFLTTASEAISQLVEQTNIPSRKIAVENIEFPFEMMEETIKELDLSICFDTGHLLAGYSGEIKTMEFIEKYFDRIIELHLHDGAFPKIDHKPLGKHELPVKELLSFLDKKNFSGPLVYELTLDEAIESMKYIKKILPEVIK